MSIKTLVRKPTLEIQPGKKRNYTSRRFKTFDDDDSCGDEDVLSSNKNIEWKNSNDEEVTLPPN
jgi:hypothetical protein